MFVDWHRSPDDDDLADVEWLEGEASLGEVIAAAFPVEEPECGNEPHPAPLGEVPDGPVEFFGED